MPRVESYTKISCNDHDCYMWGSWRGHWLYAWRNMNEQCTQRTPTCQHLLNMPGYWTWDRLVKCHSAWLMPVLLSTVIYWVMAYPPYHLSDFTFYYNITGLPILPDLPWVSWPHKLISWVARFLWEHLLMSLFMDASAFRNIKCSLETRLRVTDSRSMNSAKWTVSCY